MTKRMLRNTLLLVAVCLVPSIAVADFDFSTPEPADRDAATSPEQSAAEINDVIGGLREALGTTGERDTAPTEDALSNMGAPEYGTADDDPERPRGKGRNGVDPAISIGGLPSISLPTSGGGTPGSSGSGMPGSPGGSPGTSMPGAAGAQGGGKGSQRMADLDRALDKSLDGFDGVIMDEQQQARERQQAAGGAAESGTMAAGPSSPITMAGDQGEGEGDAEAEASASSGDIAMRGDQPPMPSGRARSAGKQGSAGASRNTAGTGNDNGGAEESDEQAASNDVPDDIAPVDNNDVIGRQIQEAATAERDPMLRGKLWEELRRHQAKR